MAYDPSLCKVLALIKMLFLIHFPCLVSWQKTQTYDVVRKKTLERNCTGPQEGAIVRANDPRLRAELIVPAIAPDHPT